MSYKKFSYAFIVLAAAILLLTVGFWHFKVERTFYTQDGHGDLARLASYAVPMPLERNPAPYGAHAEFQQYVKQDSHDQYDILTVGDSLFSGVGGSYAQDFLAADTGASILNVSRLGKYNQLDQLFLLEKCGWLDRIRPKVLVLEIGGRGAYLLPHISSMLADRTSPHKYRQEILQAKPPEPEVQIPPGTLVNTEMGIADIRYFQDRIVRFTHPGYLSKEVERRELTRDVFSNPGHERELLTYVDETNYRNPQEKPDAVAINSRLNDIAVELGKRGIQFAVVIVPTKLDVYYPWLEDVTDLPQNTFYEKMKLLEKKYAYFDTLEPLRAAVARGEKDIFWQDDTHWSYKGQKIIMDELAYVIRGALGNRRSDGND